MEKILKRFQAGEAAQPDLDLLLDVANNIEGNTICALGDAAAWPVQSFIKLFRDELEKKVRPSRPAAAWVPPPHLVTSRP
jgi:NADH-quinone oxidoreductase subunit F